MAKYDYKPCPFCGGTSQKVKHWGSMGMYFVACSCTAAGTAKPTPAEAVRSWNERAEQPPTLFNM